MFLRAKRPQRRRARKANRTPYINTAVFLFTLFNFGFVFCFFFVVVVASQHFFIFHTHTGYFYFIEILSEFIILDCDARFLIKNLSLHLSILGC